MGSVECGRDNGSYMTRVVYYFPLRPLHYIASTHILSGVVKDGLQSQTVMRIAISLYLDLDVLHLDDMS